MASGESRGQPDRPFAVMEWKLSVSHKTPHATLKQYQDDIEWLQHNASLMWRGMSTSKNARPT
jgi:hypothetical protein